MISGIDINVSTSVSWPPTTDHRPEQTAAGEDASANEHPDPLGNVLGSGSVKRQTCASFIDTDAQTRVLNTHTHRP